MESVKQSIYSATTAVTGNTNSQSGTEPPSGIRGQGTATEPYDQGNAPENVPASGEEPPSGIKGAGTAEKPYDQGNTPEAQTTSSTQSQPLNTTVDNPTSTKVGPTSTTQQTTPQVVQPPSESKATDTKSTAMRTAARDIIIDDGVSPGTLPDGSHAQTSAEKGQGYFPPSNTMGKLKGKLHFGRH